MPGGGREVTNQGVNSQGNQYTSYNDGGYRYSNKSGDGSKTTSSYFDTGKGHSFYDNKAGSRESEGQPYKVHTNQNTGKSNYY